MMTLIGRVIAGCFAALLLSGCASIHSDRFHTLLPVPPKTAEARDRFSTAISLHVALPTLVDRDQFVLSRNSDVVILEHERWAAPLSDQLASVLGQNIEQRRPDVIITSSPQTSSPGVSMLAVKVDVVALELRQNGGAGSSGVVRLESRWQIRTAGGDAQSGRDSFESPAPGGTPDALTRALSDCVGALSDRLIQQLGPPAVSRSN